MREFKIDTARRMAKIDGKKYRGQTLEYFVKQNTFDKHQSDYFNYKGLTYVVENPAGEEDEDIFFPINLQYQDTPEQARLFKMKSMQEIEEINAIKSEYGYNN